MQRRSLIKSLGGLMLLPGLAKAGIRHRDIQGAPAGAGVRGGAAHALRIAHITDVHLKGELDAPRHFADCLHHINAQDRKVDLILNGGDMVFDMNKENLDTINAQWKLVHQLVKNENSIPIRYALGNHDIWWFENDKGQAAYGKQCSLDQLQLPKAYYSFTQAGWKFIVLDSVHLDIDNTWYIGKLGDEQFQWLEQELKATDPNMPVLVLSHIPILTSTVLVEDNIVNRWEVLGGQMHTDTTKIVSLFYQHPNVKLCLSGHIHLREQLVYDNLTFLCNGAVSGAWWRGNNRETAPGYGLIDLYTDGSFDEKYVNYQGPASGPAR
jgi:Icc protein